MGLDLGEVERQLSTRSVGRRVVYATRTASTQDLARAQAEGEAVPGTVVLAEEQTAGRGRFGRVWVSPAGKNLYLTLVMRPELAGLRALGIVAPLAVALAIEDRTGLSPQIKWPNDVLIGGRKVAGVLIESELAGQTVRYSLIGIGVNVNFDIDPASDIGSIATSVKRELGHEVSREELLAALLNRFEELYEEAPRGNAVHAAWRLRLETLGRQVRVTFRDQVQEGVAEDVDGEGNLILRRADGCRITMEAGEVSLREP